MPICWRMQGLTKKSQFRSTAVKTNENVELISSNCKEEPSSLWHLQIDMECTQNSFGMKITPIMCKSFAFATKWCTMGFLCADFLQQVLPFGP